MSKKEQKIFSIKDYHNEEQTNIIFECYKTGKQFLDATIRINGNILPEHFALISTILYIPLLTNISLSCKFFLKAYNLIKNKQFKEHHDLYDLYAECKDLKTPFMELYKKVKTKEGIKNFTAKEMENVLKNCRNLYLEKYYFTKGIIKDINLYIIEFLTKICILLHSLITKNFPDFKKNIGTKNEEMEYYDHYFDNKESN